MLLVPGVEHGHREAVVALAAVCVGWGVFCVALARPERHGAWFWHVPATGSLFIVAGVAASTGGADSPARFYLFFLLVYAAYFYRRHEALPYVLGCIPVALLPLLYDREAVRDPLTALPNRRAMIDWLTAETERESPTGLILVDLDGFKDVNTAHGYPAGDAVLCDTAARLIGAARQGDVVARLGGDELAVLAPQ